MVLTRRFKAAFSPTIDCAVLVVAFEKGFAADEGVSLTLLRKPSAAATLTDWTMDALNGAHLPASLALGADLAIEATPFDLIVPFILATGGTSLAVSEALHDDLVGEGMKIPDPGSVSRALSRVVLARRNAGRAALSFATDHPLSPSTYALRYLLGAARQVAPRDITLTHADPADMPQWLDEGRIDGFLAPEPHASAAVLAGTDRIVTTGSHIWRNGAQAGLAVSRPWAAENQETLHALLRGLYRAGEWCANPANVEELSELLAETRYLASAVDVVLPALRGFIPHSPVRLLECHGFLSLGSGASNFPWQSQALWFFNQMIRWNDCPADYISDEKAYEVAMQSFRPDIYRAALKPIFAPVPAANMKVEGTLASPVHVGASRTTLLLGPDTFFDGRVFDPEKLDASDDA